MSVTLKTTLFPAVCAGPVYCCTSAVYYLLFVLSACFCSILEQKFLAAEIHQKVSQAFFSSTGKITFLIL